MIRRNLKFTLATAMLLFAMAAVAQRPQGLQQRNPEEQAKAQIDRLEQALKLNQAQKDSIYGYALQQYTQQQALFKDAPADRKAISDKIQSISNAAELKIKTFLTDEQVKNYDELKKQMQERRQNNRRP